MATTTRPSETSTLSASPSWTESQRTAQRQAARRLFADLEIALKRGDRQFVVAPGEYRFDHETGRNFSLYRVNDFELIAEGATFWFSPQTGVRLEMCARVRVRGLTVDTDPLPWWQGTIVRIDPAGKTLDIVLDHGYSLPEVEDLTRKHRTLFFDAKSERELFLLDEETVRLSLPGNNRVRVERFSRGNAFSDPLIPRLPRVGDKMVMINARHRGGNVRLDNCREVVLEDVRVYGAGSFAFHEVRGYGSNVYRNCRLIRRPGTNRLMAAASDGFHSSSMERGPLVEGCELSSAADDLLAIQGFFCPILRCEGSRQLLLVAPFGPAMREGSLVQVARMPDGELRGEARVVTISEVEDDDLRNAGRSLPMRLISTRQVRIRELGNATVYRVQLDRDIDADEFDLVSCADFAGAGAIVRRNHLHDGHIRGILVKSTDTTVEDNVVERTGHGGIVFEAELYWLEGPFNSRALIRRNHLADIGGGALDSLGISLTLAAIQVGNSFGQRMFPRMLTLGTQNTEIEITDNQVLRPVAFPIWVRNVDRAVVRGNRITAPFAGGALPGFIDMSRLLSPRAVASDRDRELLREPYYGVLLQNVSAATIGPNPVFGAPVYYKAELGTVTLQATP